MVDYGLVARLGQPERNFPGFCFFWSTGRRVFPVAEVEHECGVNLVTTKQPNPNVASAANNSDGESGSASSSPLSISTRRMVIVSFGGFIVYFWGVINNYLWGVHVVVMGGSNASCTLGGFIMYFWRVTIKYK